jgi:uncharacterized membrane protein YhhN
MVKKIALFVFLIVSILDIIGIIFKIDSLTFIFKPFILLALLFLYSQSVEFRNKWYAMALIFCFFGDVFLLYSGENVFKFGLGFFLIAHLIFITIVAKRIEKISFLNGFISIISFSIVLFLLLFLLKDSLNDLFIPVLIYGVVICTFGVVSLLDFLNTKSEKSLLMFLGAIVFIVSDAILAINKFYNAALALQVAVMVTYISAQYLIYSSMVLDKKKEH